MKKPLKEFAQSSEEYCLSPASKKKMTKNDKEQRMEKIKVKYSFLHFHKFQLLGLRTMQADEQKREHGKGAKMRRCLGENR